jgi:hypothetical protein
MEAVTDMPDGPDPEGTLFDRSFLPPARFELLDLPFQDGAALPAAFDGEKSAQAAAADIAPQLQALLDQGKGFPDVKK